jgi:hypothetical protein
MARKTSAKSGGYLHPNLQQENNLQQQHGQDWPN